MTAGSIHLGAQHRLCYGTVAMTAWLLRASKVIMYASTGGPYSVLGYLLLLGDLNRGHLVG